MGKKLKILFLPKNLVGHITGSIPLAQVLQKRGHQIIYGIEESQALHLADNDFTVETIDDSDYDSNKQLVDFARKFDLFGEKNMIWFINVLIDIKSLFSFAWMFIAYYFYRDVQIKRIVRRIEPDILISDEDVCYPSILCSKIPYVWFASKNPLEMIHELKLTHDKTDHSFVIKNSGELSELMIAFMQNSYKNLYRIAYPLLGYNFEQGEIKYLPHSNRLNLYCFPKELDYDYEINDKKPIFRIETNVIKDSKCVEFNENLKKFIENNRNSKLIYVGMGSICTGDVKFMKKLVRYLSSSKHKFIVSKGIYHHEYELSDNMYGEKWLPQKELLPFVDLVISHGGGNTVMEALTNGKPMVMIPLFVDGFETANRVEERKYGIKLDANNLFRHDLDQAIENLINDKFIQDRLAKVSKRLLSSDSLNEAAKRVENLISANQGPNNNRDSSIEKKFQATVLPRIRA